MPLEHERIVTEACGCRYDKKTGLRTNDCGGHKIASRDLDKANKVVVPVADDYQVMVAKLPDDPTGYVRASLGSTPAPEDPSVTLAYVTYRGEPAAVLRLLEAAVSALRRTAQ